MVKETHAFGLPLLDVNPFSSRPLESGDATKLVGRKDQFALLRSYLRLGTARRVMLTGPLGSGRTSLVRCLKPYAGAYISIDHLPASAPAQAMLEMCYEQLIGGEPPLGRNELVNRLVTEMYGYSDKLPLVVIDVPASDLSVVEVALRDAHSSLERLKALVVLVCDVKERHQLPATVVNGFEPFKLRPFSALDVMKLVEQRLREVGIIESQFTVHDANTILDACDGYPASVIAMLRDAVDTLRMQQSNASYQPYIDSSAKPQPREEPNQLGSLMTPVLDEVSSEGTDDLLPLSDRVEDESEIIDASIPWDQRDEDGLTVDGDDEEELSPMSMFDLDIGALDEAQSNDEPLQPPPFPSSIIDASDPSLSRSLPTSGPFGRLADRNKDFLGVKDQFRAEAKNRQGTLQEASASAQLWVDEASLPKAAPEPVSEDESAALIHDEIGLPEPIHEEMPAIEEPLFDAPESTPSPSLEVPTPAHHAVDQEQTMQLLEALLTTMGPSSKGVSPVHERLMAFFEARAQNKVGPKEIFPLDKHLLGSLNSVEAYVVGVANDRPFSPSDRVMLQHLKVKRARLSQISNRLLKHGILQVRQSGRSRNYSLTQTARAQLVAWGALDGGGL